MNYDFNILKRSKYEVSKPQILTPDNLAVQIFTRFYFFSKILCISDEIFKVVELPQRFWARLDELKYTNLT